MFLARFAVRQPVLVNLLAIVLSVGGIFAFSTMTREELPEVEARWAYTTVVWPGATPAEIEALIVDPIEDEIGDIPYLESVESTARENYAEVWLAFDTDVPDLDRATMQLAQAVDRAELPEDAEAPVTIKWTRDFPAIQVAIRGSDLSRLKPLADALQDELSSVDGASEVLVSGLSDPEVLVEVDRARAEALGLPLPWIVEAIDRSSIGLPAGSLDAGRQEFLVRVDQRQTGAASVEDVVLRVGPDGSVLRLGEVARVADDFAPARSNAWVDGERAVLLTVMKTREGDLIRMVDGVEKVVERFSEDLPPGVSLSLHADASRGLEQVLGDLYANGLMGLVLVSLLLGFSLGPRNAAMASIGLPVALAGGVLVMVALGITINMLSLFSLIIVLGIVVDDAIVVIENVVRYAERGHPLHVAAVVGTAQVAVPVVAATLTTVSAFLPLLVMTGVMGKFFSIIPKVVAAVLVASLIEALFVLPSHLADWGAVPKRQTPGWVLAMRARYERMLRWSLGHRVVIICGVLMLSVASVGLGVATLDLVMFTDVDADIVDVRVDLPVGTNMETTEAVLGAIEVAAVEAVPAEMLRTSLVESGYRRTDGFPKVGSHVGQVVLDLEPWQTRDYRADRVAAALREAVADVPGPVAVQVTALQQAPPAGKPVAVEIRGNDFHRLEELASQMMASAAAIPGVEDLGSDLDPGKRELRVHIDPVKAARHGLTVADVAGAIRLSLTGGIATSIRQGSTPVEIRVRYAELDGIGALGSLGIPTSAGFVPLSELATIDEDRGWSVIRHKDRVRKVQVSADVDPAVTTSVEVNTALRAAIGEAPPGYTYDFGGEFSGTQDSFTSLFQAFWIAALLIYTILAAQFRSYTQPLVVLVAVPFCFIGVVLGLLVTQSPFGMLAGIGVVALTGIVVNDSLVLVDFINGKRRAGMELIEAVVSAGRERMRPIFLTSVTTIAGLMPLGLGLGGENPLLSPMATSISWGLVFATGLTLIVVPCLYVSVDRIVFSLTGKTTAAESEDGLEDVARLSALMRPEWEDSG